jgi:hypothetical protein
MCADRYSTFMHMYERYRRTSTLCLLSLLDFIVAVAVKRVFIVAVAVKRVFIVAVAVKRVFIVAVAVKRVFINHCSRGCRCSCAHVLGLSSSAHTWAYATHISTYLYKHIDLHLDTYIDI